MKKISLGKIIMTILLGFVLLLILCIILIKIWSDKYRMDGDGMINAAAVDTVSYFSGQDEYGRSESFNLQDSTLTYDRQGGTVSESYDDSCEIDADFEQSLEDIIRKYGMYDWTDLPANEYQADDAPIAVITISFYNGIVVNLGDNYQMPENGWQAVNEILTLFESRFEEHK